MMGRATEQWSGKLWNELITKIARSNSEKEVKNILEKLITENEKNMILRRLAVIALIQSGNSYRAIGKILWLSPNTVSAMKKNILGKHANYKRYLGFCGGPIRRGSLSTRGQKSYTDGFIKLILAAIKIFEPSARKGLGVMGDQHWK